MATQTKPAKQPSKADTAPTIEVTEEPVSTEQAASSPPKPQEAPAKKEEPSKQDEPAHKDTPNAAEPKKAAPVDSGSLVGRADAIVRRNVLWSLGAGVVPVAIVDAIALTGVQLKMLAELSELYGVKFSEDAAKKVVGALLSSLGGVTIGTFVGISLAKLVPVVGPVLGIVTVPVIGGAFTHATGKVFIMHFEAGGTLLNFDPHKMRHYFKMEFEKAKQTVVEVPGQKQSTTTNAP